MSDAISSVSLSGPWQAYIQPVSALLQSIPVPGGACILLVLAAPEPQSMVSAAAALAGGTCAVLPADAPQAAVAQAVAQHQPAVVVCAPDVFGWVSKLAFLGGSAAIYTCGADGEGTLLDRASHFES